MMVLICLMVRPLLGFSDLCFLKAPGVAEQENEGQSSLTRIHWQISTKAKKMLAEQAFVQAWSASRPKSSYAEVSQESAERASVRRTPSCASGSVWHSDACSRCHSGQ